MITCQVLTWMEFVDLRPSENKMMGACLLSRACLTVRIFPEVRNRKQTESGLGMLPENVALPPSVKIQKFSVPDP